MSDGAAIDEAIANDREALRDCIDVFKESGRTIRSPASKPLNGATAFPGPSTPSLTKHAENEGVSVSSLVTAIIAEAIGAKHAR